MSKSFRFCNCDFTINYNLGRGRGVLKPGDVQRTLAGRDILHK